MAPRPSRHGPGARPGRRVEKLDAPLFVETQVRQQPVAADRLRGLCRLRQPVRDQLAGPGTARIDLPQTMLRV